jgi:hypothetical protein
MSIRDYTLNDLCGLAELAERFEVPYSTVLSWSRTRDFPAPAKQFKMGPCWSYDEIAEYRRNKEGK